MGKDESSEIKRTQIHEAVKLRLWGMSAGRCEICNKLLYLDSRYGDDANFAENAHIHAVGKTGPRHVDDMTQAILPRRRWMPMAQIFEVDKNREHSWMDRPRS